MEKQRGKLTAITGNIGSGKSTVAEILKREGYLVLSADEFTEKAYVVASSQLEEAFGKEIFQNGKVDRKSLGKIAFSSGENIKTLNDIMHPTIFNLIWKSAEGREEVFVEVPLLFESGMENNFQEVWLVSAEEEQKVERASKRDNASELEIKKRLSFQISDEEKESKVHILIKNNKTLADLEKRVLEILQSK